MPFTPTLPQLARLKSDPEDQQEDGDAEEEQSTQPDNQTLLRLLDENEKVNYYQMWLLFTKFKIFRLHICLDVQGFKA